MLRFSIRFLCALHIALTAVPQYNVQGTVDPFYGVRVGRLCRSIFPRLPKKAPFLVETPLYIHSTIFLGKEYLFKVIDWTVCKDYMRGIEINAISTPLGRHSLRRTGSAFMVNMRPLHFDGRSKFGLRFSTLGVSPPYNLKLGCQKAPLFMLVSPNLASSSEWGSLVRGNTCITLRTS